VVCGKREGFGRKRRENEIERKSLRSYHQSEK